MRICIVGTGYVGLVSAACFAEMGNDVRCVDVNPEVVALLDSGRIHIFEPGLEDLVSRNRQEGRLRFTTSLAEGLDGAEFAFITVGTPSRPDGSCDLSYVEGVARQIGEQMRGPLIVVTSPQCPSEPPTASASSSPPPLPPVARRLPSMWCRTPNSSRKATRFRTS